jgi:hypothetical protein
VTLITHQISHEDVSGRAEAKVTRYERTHIAKMQVTSIATLDGNILGNMCMTYEEFKKAEPKLVEKLAKVLMDHPEALMALVNQAQHPDYDVEKLMKE